VASQRIVFIDPDAVSRQYVTFVLRQRGYEAVGAATAAEGLAAARGVGLAAIVVEPLELDIPAEQLANRIRLDAELQQAQTESATWGVGQVRPLEPHRTTAIVQHVAPHVVFGIHLEVP
jgi:CheY-like chemotaxis protein